jgi:phenylalanyl-tRNA synthetase beta chain
VLKIEVAANRYDMLCFEGIAQALAVFQGKAKIPNYRLVMPEKLETLTIKPEVTLI